MQRPEFDQSKVPGRDGQHNGCAANRGTEAADYDRSWPALNAIIHRTVRLVRRGTTYCQIDPKEKIVAIALVQHFPFNQHNFFAAFQTGYYQALK